MKKNGYISVISNIDIDNVKKGDELMTSSTEFGSLDDDAIITCFTKDGDEVSIPKNKLEVKD